LALAFALGVVWCVITDRPGDGVRRGGLYDADLASGDISSVSPIWNEIVSREWAQPTGVTEEPAASNDLGPVLAVVVDDCGGSLEMARRLLSVDIPLTWSVIPYLRYSEKTAELLLSEDVPFLVHVPMQALGDADGKAGERNYYHIGVGMTREAVAGALEPMLDSLPGAYGINNHRGSKATADSDVMDSVMRVLAKRGMFFMDSRTSPKSVAYKSALKNGVAAAENSHFLDNEPDRARIAEELAVASAMAKKRGSAIAICHLRPETVAFFEDFKAGKIEVDGINAISAVSAIKFVTLPQLMELRKGELYIDEK
jgi:polysaccharide deacetylase 2 family uncharacterized protein YibQ